MYPSSLNVHDGNYSDNILPKSPGNHTQTFPVHEFRSFICCTLLCLGVKIPYKSHNKALKSSEPQLMLSCGLRLKKLIDTFQRRIIVLMADVSMHITGGFKGFSFKTTTNSKHTGDYGTFVVTISFVTSTSHHLLLIVSNVIIHHDNDLLVWNSISVYNLVCMAHICLKLSKFSLLVLTEISSEKQNSSLDLRAGYCPKQTAFQYKRLGLLER